MTYLDMADDTYTHGLSETIEERRRYGRIEVYDSNTVGKKYLCVKVTDKLNSGAHIRLHKGQVKRLIKALQKFVEYAEGEAR